MTILQSDGYETGCFNNKIWSKYYCLGKNHVSEALSSKFMRCQNPYQLQNSKILTTLQGHKNLHVQCKMFGVGFFLSGRTRLYRYYQRKTQVGIIPSSYINLAIKLLLNCIY